MVLGLDWWTTVGSGRAPRQAVGVGCHLPCLSPVWHPGRCLRLPPYPESVNRGAEHGQRHRPCPAMRGLTALGSCPNSHLLAVWLWASPPTSLSLVSYLSLRRTTPPVTEVTGWHTGSRVFPSPSFSSLLRGPLLPRTQRIGPEGAWGSSTGSGERWRAGAYSQLNSGSNLDSP